jgi:LysR family transcriptional regulator, nitrogen assimilation regulatory protein
VNLHDLRIFRTICEAGNLTRAAAELGMSQPALSRRVRDLERGFALPLFRRTGRGVEATQAGQLLRRHAERALAEHAELEAAFDRMRQGETGTVTMLLPHYVSRVLVPPLIRRFTATFPAAAIHVFEEAAVEIPGRLAAGRAALGVFYGTHRGPGLAVDRLALERAYLVGRRDVLGDVEAPIPFVDAARMPLIVSSRASPFRRHLERHAREAGCRLRVVREIEVSYSALAFVLDGEGSAILPLSHFHAELAQGALVARPIGPPAVTREILMAFAPGPRTALGRAAADIVGRVVAEEGAVVGWHAPAEGARDGA